MPVTSPKPRLIGGFLLWFAAGTVIAALVSELSASQFQRHVRAYYPRGIQHSDTMQLIADIGSAALPFTLVSPALGPAYYCWRKRLPLSYLFKSTSTAVVLGLFFSGSAQGTPDQPFRHVIPTLVFFATLFALAIQIMLEDWDTVNSGSEPLNIQ